MKRANFILITIFSLNCYFSFSQEKPDKWTLRNSIDYALKNNIQIQQAKLSQQSTNEDFLQSKASVFPTLSASASESFSNTKILNSNAQYGYNQSFTGNYSLNSSLNLFNGFKTKNNIEQQKLYLKSSDLAINEAENNIEIAITQAYLQILFAKESVKTAELNLEVSKAQIEREKLLFDAGSIAQSDYAQLSSQFSNDKYQLVVAKNNFENQVLTLKQLLEFGINDTIDLYYPEIADDDILVLSTSKEEIYNTALSFMPQIENKKIETQTAEYELKKAKGSLYPSLNLNAAFSTTYAGTDSENYVNQLNHNFNQSIALSLNFNIFNQREVKTGIAKSKIAIENAKLNLTATEKDLLKTVESVYLDVISSQNRFSAAQEALKSSKISYELTEEKYGLGMKNTFEFLTEKNNYLNAQQEYLQAKYASILNQKLLDFYQNKPIDL